MARAVSPTSAAIAPPRAPSTSISTTPSPAAKHEADRDQSREPDLRKEGGDQCEDLDPENRRGRLVLGAAKETEDRSSNREDDDGHIAADQESHLRHALRHVLESLGLVGSRGQHGERDRGGDCVRWIEVADVGNVDALIAGAHRRSRCAHAVDCTTGPAEPLVTDLIASTIRSAAWSSSPSPRTSFHHDNASRSLAGRPTRVALASAASSYGCMQIPPRS